MPEVRHRELRADAQHRRSMERLIVRHNERRADISQIMHFVIVLIVFAGGFTTIASGHVLAGAALLAAASKSPLISPMSGRASVKKVELFKTARGRAGGTGVEEDQR
jgi:hypothetical protein